MVYFLNVYRNLKSGSIIADILDNYSDAVEELAHADTAAWGYIETFYRDNNGAGIINLQEAVGEYNAGRAEEAAHEHQERWAGS